MDGLQILALHHHAELGLGAGHAHQHAAHAHQLLLLVLNETGQHFVLFVGGLLGSIGGHIHQHLGVLFIDAVQLAHLLAALGQQLEQLAGGQLAVTGGGMVQQDHMAALLTADGVAVLAHVLQHIAVAHSGLFRCGCPGSPCT